MGTNARGRATQQRLLDATERVFARTGYALSVEQVAEEGNVARPTVYRHFASRDDLITAMVLRTSGQLAADLTAILDGDGTFSDQLVDVLVHIVERVRATPHLLALVERGDVGVAWPEVDPRGRLVDVVVAFFTPWVERAVASGDVVLRAPTGDVIDWMLRTTVLQMLVPGAGGDSSERLRYEIRTFVLPALVAS